jgi:hypothetical protein
MKKLLILILLIPISLFSQSHINRDIVNKEFQRLLNEERKNNGLSPLFIDTVHTQMEDDWSENIAYRYESDMEKTKLKLYRSGKKKIKYSLPDYHGEGENDFDKRFERYYPNFHTRVRGECIFVFGLYVNKSEVELARYCFEELKSSPPHYDIMMNPKINSMYGSLYGFYKEEYTKESVPFRSNYWYGFCLIVFAQ